MICLNCKEEKGVDAFSLEKRGYRRKICKDCRTQRISKYRSYGEGKKKARELAKTFYKNHPGYYAQYLSDERLIQMREGLTRARKRNRQIADLAKSRPCADCGQSFPSQAMDFDHVRGEKFNDVGSMVSQGRSRAQIEAEIAKCEVVCANCHRIRTNSRRVAAVAVLTTAFKKG